MSKRVELRVWQLEVTLGGAHCQVPTVLLVQRLSQQFVDVGTAFAGGS